MLSCWKNIYNHERDTTFTHLHMYMYLYMCMYMYVLGRRCMIKYWWLGWWSDLNYHDCVVSKHGDRNAFVNEEPSSTSLEWSCDQCARVSCLYHGNMSRLRDHHRYQVSKVRTSLSRRYCRRKVWSRILKIVRLHVYMGYTIMSE